MTTPLTAEQKATERMAQAYPTLSAFYSKYALGSMTAPSCFGCGHVGERSTTHLELPDMYLCTSCVAKIRGRQGVNANEKHGCHGGDGATLPTTPLTAQEAGKCRPYKHVTEAEGGLRINEALDAIRDGEHVVIPRWTEERAGAFFNVWVDDKLFIPEMHRRLLWECWSACARVAGILGDKT